MRFIGAISVCLGVLMTLGFAYADIIYVDDDNTTGPWDGTEDHPFQFIQDGIDVAVGDDS